MNPYYGWSLVLWPLFFFLVWGAFALWPWRRGWGYRDRFGLDYYSGYDMSQFGGVPFPRYSAHRGKGPRNYRRPDQRIAEDINDRLLMHAEIDATDIEVKVQNGEVTLTGKVNSRSDRRLAEWLADSVGGVQDVKNELAVEARTGADRKAA